MPKAPLTWLEGGRVTAKVEDRWSLSDDEIDMDWLFELDGISVKAPEGAGGAERLLAGGLAKAGGGPRGRCEFRVSAGIDETPGAGHAGRGFAGLLGCGSVGRGGT